MPDPGSLTVTEAIRREIHPDSGAQVWQITSAPAIHTNIYGEVPYMDASSRWFLLTRSRESYGPVEMWRADLERHWLTPVCEGAAGIAGVAVSPDQRFFYCVRERAGDAYEIVRTGIETLEQRALGFQGDPRIGSLGSVGPDHRTYIASARLAPRRWGVVRFDLETGAREVIHEGPEICNAHPQIEPGEGRDILIQHNRGCAFDEQGRLTQLVGEQGATLYVIDRDGDHYRPLPVGRPHTWPVQGHQCWIGATGEVLLTVVGGTAEEMERAGILLAMRPGGEQARVVARGHRFWHPNASRDGRFFVSDTMAQGTLVVGSLATGRTRVLCESAASCGAPQYTHPHPYFSPDRRWVIFNSDRSGVPQVYAVRVPEGLLEALEGGG